MLAMLELHAHVRARGAVRTGLIGDQDTRSAGLFAEELAKQAFGGASVAATLNQSIEDKAVLIDGAPKPVLFAIDCDLRPNRDATCRRIAARVGALR